MARPKKENHPMSIRISSALFDKLQMFCYDSGQTKTVAIERALDAYINKYYYDQEKLKELK